MKLIAPFARNLSHFFFAKISLRHSPLFYTIEMQFFPLHAGFYSLQSNNLHSFFLEFDQQTREVSTALSQWVLRRCHFSTTDITTRIVKFQALPKSLETDLRFFNFLSSEMRKQKVFFSLGLIHE